jgi:hypothetical protein
VSACSNKEGHDLESYRKALADYDQAVEEVVGGTVAIGDAVASLQTALAADDTPAVDASASGLSSGTNRLLEGLTTLEELENRLQGVGDVPPEGMITKKLVFIIGVGLAIYGTYTFGKKMKSLSDEMSKARQERDEAADRVMQGDPQGEQDLKNAKQKMNEIGSEAATELASKVTTDLAMTPINPGNAGGMILKNMAGNLLQDGIKVITATKDCATDPSSGGCKISVQKTNANGKVKVPAGEQSILVSTKGKARVAVAEVTVPEGGDVEVKRELIPVEDATPENVGANDRGEYQPPTSSVDGGPGPEAGLGPKCQTLAACCPNITDSEYLRQTCEKEVATGRELNCSVMLINISHLEYCH